MKKYKGYTIIDLILLLSGLITMITLGIICHSQWFIIVNTLIALSYVFAQAKAKLITNFLGILYFCFYIFICYSNKYYGEALVYLLIMLPLHTYGLIHWLCNKDKVNKVVKIRNNLSKKEWIIFGISLSILSIITFIILKKLNTSALYINTFSCITLIPAVYLLSRRHKYNHISFLINDFIASLLWIRLIINGVNSYLIMAVYHLFQITYDIYGFIEWKKIIKIQENDK